MEELLFRQVAKNFEGKKDFKAALKSYLSLADPKRMANMIAQYEVPGMYDKGEGTERNPERSFYWMKEAVEQGYVPAQYSLAVKYDTGDGVKRNSELAQKYFKLAAKGGHPLAQSRCSGAF